MNRLIVALPLFVFAAVFGHTAAAQAPAAAGTPATSSAPIPVALGRDEQLTVVVHSAENCPICKLWRLSESGLPVARQLSQQWPKLRIVYVERKSLHGSEAEADYPAELQYLYQARQARYQLSPAVPMFEIVRNRQVVARQRGIQGWTDGIVPVVQQLEAGRPR